MEKIPEKITWNKKGPEIPLQILGNEKLSILESVVIYLNKQGLRNKEIAELIGKDSRMIATTMSRARKKGGGAQ